MAHQHPPGLPPPYPPQLRYKLTGDLTCLQAISLAFFARPVGFSGESFRRCLYPLLRSQSFSHVATPFITPWRFATFGMRIVTLCVGLAVGLSFVTLPAVPGLVSPTSRNLDLGKRSWLSGASIRCGCLAASSSIRPGRGFGRSLACLSLASVMLGAAGRSRSRSAGGDTGPRRLPASTLSVAILSPLPRYRSL